jgi:hypothetical protein
MNEAGEEAEETLHLTQRSKGAKVAKKKDKEITR